MDDLEMLGNVSWKSRADYARSVPLTGVKPIANDGATGRRILLVEDDPAISELIEAVLIEDARFEVQRAARASEAIEFVERCSGDGSSKPNMILLDVALPDKENFVELIEMMESRGTSPVILLSARPMRELEALATRIKADGILMKPFDIEELLDTVNTALKLNSND